MDKKEREGHMKILSGMFFNNIQRDSCEYGAWGIDCKRPFGNSDVEGDILDELGVKPEGEDDNEGGYSEDQRQYAAGLYDDLGEWLSKQWSKTWSKQ